MHGDGTRPNQVPAEEGFQGVLCRIPENQEKTETKVR